VFTGLIQDVGEIEAVEAGGEGARLRIATSLGPEIGLGDSVAVDGVCLTATVAGAGGFETEAMNQTLAVTALGALVAGAAVNLELAVQVSDRLGGHIVQGHVDGVGTVAAVVEDGFARRLRVRLDPGLLRYAVDKGSITLSGVSLTIAALGEDWAEVSLIPETLERTTLGRLGPGSRLNVECDIVAKYVERLLAPFAGKERA
jgi:riboflavin synthase